MKSSKFSNIINEKLNSLKEKYSIKELFLVKNDFIVLIMKFKKLDQFIENNAKLFDSLTSSLSMYLEIYLNDDFKRWNVYVIYLAEELVSREIKYKIENDPFFARKIVEDNYSLELTDESIEKLISEHVMLNDLQINSAQPAQEEYYSVSEIYQKLKDVDTMNQTQIDEMLKSLEGVESEI